MANKSISELTAGGAVADTDLFVDVQTVGQGPVKVTGSQVKTYVNNSPSLTGSVTINGTPISGVSGTGYLAATTAPFFNDPFISGASFNGVWGLNFDTYPGLVVDYPTANNARYLVYGNNGVHTFYNGTSASTPQLLQITSDGALNPTEGIIGKTDASNATAGQVGEYISSFVVAGSAVGLTTGTARTVTSITLTAGDWDVEGAVGFTLSSTGTGCTALQACVSLATNTFVTAPTANGFPVASIQSNTSFSSGGSNRLAGLYSRVNVSVSTNVFLVASSNFTSGSVLAFGAISARRVR